LFIGIVGICGLLFLLLRRRVHEPPTERRSLWEAALARGERGVFEWLVAIRGIEPSRTPLWSLVCDPRAKPAVRAAAAVALDPLLDARERDRLRALAGASEPSAVRFALTAVANRWSDEYVAHGLRQCDRLG
jgi:hypothetical protein